MDLNREKASRRLQGGAPSAAGPSPGPHSESSKSIEISDLKKSARELQNCVLFEPRRAPKIVKSVKIIKSVHLYVNSRVFWVSTYAQMDPSDAKLTPNSSSLECTLIHVIPRGITCFLNFSGQAANYIRIEPCMNQQTRRSPPRPPLPPLR